MRSNKVIFPVIFVDSNVPMYLLGKPHPNKHRARNTIHLAVMRTAGVSRILTLDRGFGACHGIERLT